MARPLKAEDGWETMPPVGGAAAPHAPRPQGAPGGYPRQKPDASRSRPALEDDQFASVQPVGYRERMAFAQEYTRPQEVLVPSPFAATEDFVQHRQVVAPPVPYDETRHTGAVPPRGQGMAQPGPIQLGQNQGRNGHPAQPRGQGMTQPGPIQLGQNQGRNGHPAQLRGQAMTQPGPIQLGQNQARPSQSAQPPRQTMAQPRPVQPLGPGLSGAPAGQAQRQMPRPAPQDAGRGMGRPAPMEQPSGRMERMMPPVSGTARTDRPCAEAPAQDKPFGPQLPPEEAGRKIPVPHLPKETIEAPMDEPAREKSERMRRSRALTKKEGPFWEPVGEEAQREADKRAKERRRRRMHVCRNVLIALTTAVLAVLLVRGAVFSMRSMQVSGNGSISDETILAEAGLRMGMSLLDVDEEAVAAQVNADRYLEFVDLRLDWPDGATLFVKERTKAATMDYCGMVYVLAADSMVLEESTDIEKSWGVPRVRGLEPKNVQVGKKLAGSARAQVRAYCAIIAELKEQGCLSIISELNVADVDNIYLITAEDYTVHLGPAEDIRAKIGAMRAVRESLLAEERTGGTIEVVTPVNPIYSPGM